MKYYDTASDIPEKVHTDRALEVLMRAADLCRVFNNPECTCEEMKRAIDETIENIDLVVDFAGRQEINIWLRGFFRDMWRSHQMKIDERKNNTDELKLHLRYRYGNLGSIVQSALHNAIKEKKDEDERLLRMRESYQIDQVLKAQWDYAVEGKRSHGQTQ